MIINRMDGDRAAWISRAVCRAGRTARQTGREIMSAARATTGFSSFLRLAVDVCLYRVLRIGAIPGYNGVRSIVVKGGYHFAYRLNRGDIQSIREVLMDEAYRLPFAIQPKVIVDLGANIGLTSIYLLRLYKPEILVAVEADADNAALARQNLEAFGASVVEAAISCEDGMGWFEF